MDGSSRNSKNPCLYLKSVPKLEAKDNGELIH